VPADGNARTVFRYERLLQRGGGLPGKARSLFAQRLEEVRDVVASAQRALAVVVLPAEGDDASLAEKAVELELLEWEILDPLDQHAFFVGRDQVGLIAESFGQRCRSGKQGQLAVHLVFTRVHFVTVR
jgi:hypothetical protein